MKFIFIFHFDDTNTCYIFMILVNALRFLFPVQPGATFMIEYVETEKLQLRSKLVTIIPDNISFVL